MTRPPEAQALVLGRGAYLTPQRLRRYSKKPHNSQQEPQGFGRTSGANEIYHTNNTPVIRPAFRVDNDVTNPGLTAQTGRNTPAKRVKNGRKRPAQNYTHVFPQFQPFFWGGEKPHSPATGQGPPCRTFVRTSRFGVGRPGAGGADGTGLGL